MIAVDAMGGDRAPQAVVQGAVAAARNGIPILLFGRKESITPFLPDDIASLSITLSFCEQEIGMDEEPMRAVRSKPHSSLLCAMKAVANNEATAFFSAGNSGAVLLASAVICGRVPGLSRPAVGTFLPSRNGSFFCLDVGGNVDVTAEQLYQFALLGHVYLGVTHGVEYPRIGLLSNGHESFKGNAVTKKAFKLLSESSLRFIGNIEASELSAGSVDIVVCDGFVGNIMLKAIQGTAKMFFQWIKDEVRGSAIRRFFLWLNRNVLYALKDRTSYASVGGALLLGVQKPVVLAHGRSDAVAIENGIRFAQQIVQEKRVEKCNEIIKDMLTQVKKGDVKVSSAATGEKQL